MRTVMLTISIIIIIIFILIKNENIYINYNKNEDNYITGYTKYQRSPSGLIIYIEEPCFQYPYPTKGSIHMDGTIFEMKEKYPTYAESNKWCEDVYFTEKLKLDSKKIYRYNN